MKLFTRFLPATFIAALMLGGRAEAPAATITWDADGTTSGVSDGAGAWLGVNQWWDGTTNVSWASGDDAVFGVGGTGGAVTLSAPTTAGSLTFDAFSGTYTLGTANQALTLGSGGLTMNAGAGAVTLVSPVTLGAAQIWTNDSASLFTTSAATTNAGHLLTVTGSGNASLAAISGVGGLAKSGSGTLTLTAINSFTGGTTVQAGTLSLGNGAANGVIRGSLAIAPGARVIASANGWSLGYGGTRAGATYSGTSVTAITIDGGTLEFTNGALGAGLAASQITLTGGTIAGASFGWINSNTLTPTLRTLASATRSTLEGGISLRLGTAGILTFDVASGSTADGIDLLVSGPISQPAAGDNLGGIIVKTGAGRLVLSGSNTFTGGLTLSAGQLDLNHASALGAGTFTIWGGTIGNSSGSPITLSTNNAQTWNSDFTFVGPSSLNLGTGAVTLGANRAVTISTGTLTVGGGISGVGRGLTKSGSGTLTLTGANTFTGATSISAGTLQVGNGGTTGTLGSGAVTNNGTLAFNRSNSIAIANAISGTGSVVQQGAGTLTLTAINSFTGGTTVQAGTLSLGNGAASGVIRGSLAIAPGARVIASVNGWSLGYGGTRAGATYSGNSVTAITIDGGTLEFTNGAGGGGLAASEITLTGGTIAGASFGWINSNTLTPTLRTLASATRSTLEGGISLRLSTAGTLTFDVASGSTADGIDLLVSGPIATAGLPDSGDNNGGNFTKTGPGTLALAAANTFIGSTSIAAGRLQVDSTGSFTATSGITLAGGELRYNSATPLARPLALTAGTISGTGTIATPVTVATGGVLSPGNSPGTQAYSQGLTWNGGGSYLWEVNALSGTAGTNWDLLNISGGTFDVSGLSAGSRFILDLTTLTAADLPGPLAVPFDGGAYAFPIASYATLSSPLGTAALTDLTSLFDLRLDNWAAPKPGLGDISVRINAAADGIELVVVPEPSTAVGGLMAVGLAAWRLRRRGPRKSS